MLCYSTRSLYCLSLALSDSRPKLFLVLISPPVDFGFVDLSCPLVLYPFVEANGVQKSTFINLGFQVEFKGIVRSPQTETQKRVGHH